MYKVLPVSVGLFAVNSYGNSLPSPAGHPDILFSGRLAVRCRVPVVPSVTPLGHSSVGPGFGFIVYLQKSMFTPQWMPVYLEASQHPRVDRMSGGAQSGGSSVALTGTYRVAVSSCSPVAKGSRPFFVDLVPICRFFMRPLQLHFLRFFSPPVGLSVETDSVVSGIRGFVCSLDISGSASRSEAFPPPPPPLSLVLTSVASQSGWGATLLTRRVSDTWS